MAAPFPILILRSCGLGQLLRSWSWCIIEINIPAVENRVSMRQKYENWAYTYVRKLPHSFYNRNHLG